MGNRVHGCINRIRIIRGVNCGQISEEQLGNLFALYRLDEQEREEVREYLSCNGIWVTAKIEHDCTSEKTPITHGEPEDTDARREAHRERYQNKLEKCLHAMADHEELVSQYGDELPLLKEAIAQYAPKREDRPYAVISRAVMDIRAVRAREGRKGVWICGTYVNRLKDLFERWLRHHLAKEDMAELIWSCSNNDSLETEYEQMLLVILHNAPKVYANRIWSEMS